MAGALSLACAGSANPPSAISRLCAATAYATTTPINGRHQRLDLIARLNMLLPTGKLTLALDLRGRKLAFLTPSLRPHEHKSLAAAFGDQLVVLVVGAMMKLDDAGTGPRLRFALADDLGRRVHGIALE